MVCSQLLRHVYILGASAGFNEIHIHIHMFHMESELGNFGPQIRFHIAHSPANSPANSTNKQPSTQSVSSQTVSSQTVPSQSVPSQTVTHQAVTSSNSPADPEKH